VIILEEDADLPPAMLPIDLAIPTSGRIPISGFGALRKTGQIVCYQPGHIICYAHADDASVVDTERLKYPR
jgi:hypothetical protein